MRSIGVWAAASVIAAGMAAGMAGAQITITGQGEIAAAPDMATISLGVTTQDTSAAGAMRANSDALAAVMARLSAAGIAPRDLQTANLQLGPNWTQMRDGAAPVISGYTASNMLNVRVRDLDQLGSVLDAVITDGANTLNGVSFAQSDPRPALDAARRAAVADAMARAALMAEAAGITLGPILSMSENSGFGGGAPMMRAMAMDSGVPVAAGEIGVTANVTIVFDLAK